MPAISLHRSALAPTALASLATLAAPGLLGVVAASGRQPGYALLRIDAKQTAAVREGAEIQPGVRLAEVRADHVVIERNGVREALAWPKPGKAATAPLASR